LGNPYYLSTWISAIAARLTGKRILFWTHGWTRKEAGPKAWIRKAFYKLSHGLLLYGHFGKMFGLAKGFRTDQLYVIYNSLDYEKQREIREHLPSESPILVKRELFKQPDWPMVICSARLTAECRFDLLLKAQAKLRDEGHPINVLLIGDGPRMSSLQLQASHLNLPVKFVGACYDERILARLTRAAHATVSPGKVGLTAMHSLAYGTPVITHDDGQAQMPEFEAIRPGRTGDFFRRDDVADLARVIRIWTSRDIPNPQTEADCYKIIDKFYNPAFQRRAIDRAVSGAPADDLFWLREQR
jgi:glycosyltransferase involved in cell wall biosynthesis